MTLETPTSSAKSPQKFNGGDKSSRTKPSNRQKATLWFDTKGFAGPGDHDGILLRAINGPYTGVILYPENVDAFKELLRKSLQVVLTVESELEWEQLTARPGLEGLLAHLRSRDLLVAASSNREALERIRRASGIVPGDDASPSLQTCLRVAVDDARSLHESIDFGRGHPFVAIRFKDPTNIPLELVIASLQSSETTVVKEISGAHNSEDAIVSLGVMEYGADGVAFSPVEHGVLDDFLGQYATRTQPRVAIEVATVTRSEAIGMGIRSCIDLATLFGPEEGMLVGSTSQGGVLCCPEVFFLPYMELRPFRVNAGAVHSYVYNFGNRTDYMSELKGGSSVMIVGADGATRRAPVGRMKTEVRPLRLIEAEFATGERINVIMQDDWHVRIFSEDRKPLNITELKAGDRILAHKAAPGRHVGIKIDERLLES